ncbi:cytochrome c biogenesis protein CcsA [Schinkia azotoformans]|uniref:Heme exporter protein C n=1 Tax=Schinkia azotoformans LMG 9581 TaxID=1131731 RepID=K6E5V8_SCHAZ|nr:cytochrome c biogenesis protein CcsA [Schinkia azotoformans]EKN68651.1 cytochrome c assembly protein [Schinkia azotoformans LMG 9581]MEC1640720.1 cytochrome c biogenesis protein CcsA [Schinkia azotoformans]MEC1720254.1 cytochrome c biogenesis protein CcsA [Schinkia azotoformans]MEC1945686.1 cytochrome c biogenesis protein CcsA [Schinkia azotoformans]MED4413257.1 cytochrome c biogenesis protein CcsA [Schinkia azotoformans]
MNAQELKIELPKQSKLHQILVYALIPLMAIALYLVFVWSPVEKTMGVVQKIFYFHVGSAWTAFLAFGVVFVCSILFLIKRKRIYDIVAGISAEIGVVFTAIVLTSGPIWGRSAWNTWWTWEPRLTTTLILFFIYIAYILIRHMDGAWEKKARLASVFGIIGFIDVPIVFMAIRWWNSKLHPIVFGDGPTQQGGGIEPPMLFTLVFTLGVITLLYVVLLQKGVYIEKTKLAVEKYKKHVQEKLMDKVS